MAPNLRSHSTFGESNTIVAHFSSNPGIHSRPWQSSCFAPLVRSQVQSFGLFPVRLAENKTSPSHRIERERKQDETHKGHFQRRSPPRFDRQCKCPGWYRKLRPRFHRRLWQPRWPNLLDLPCPSQRRHKPSVESRFHDSCIRRLHHVHGQLSWCP